MAREPSVLTFDVVGTLIDFETGMLDYIRRECGDSASALDDAAILDAYREARGDGAAVLFPDDLSRVYTKIAPGLGLPEDPAIADGLAESSRDWPPFPDAVGALRRLRYRYRLVAMTNTRRWALDAMASTLGSPFHDTVTVDEARCEKPDPAFFAYTRGRLSVDGHGLHDILHVAQSQYHDIGVARRLGYTVAWIERRQGKGSGGTIAAPVLTEPHYHFTTLHDLADEGDAGTLRMRTTG